MAVTFFTKNPKALLEQFDARIEQTEAKDGIETWRKCEDGTYTHTAKQWADQAFFSASTRAGETLTFTLTFPKKKAAGAPDSQDVYSFYHGHLIQVFFRHFLKSFDKAEVIDNRKKSAPPAKGGKTPPTKTVTPTKTASGGIKSFSDFVAKPRR